MKLRGDKKSLYAVCKTVFFGVVLAFVLYYFVGCATAVRPTCSDDSIVAAVVWNLRTGDTTYIQKSGDGRHAQAYAVINGVDTPLHVYPLFGWHVMPSRADEMYGGKGERYHTVSDFIAEHDFKGGR